MLRYRRWWEISELRPKVFIESHPASEFSAQGDLPALPQEAEELGLTDSVWGATARCRLQDPAQRPTMSEVVRLLREWLVFSVSASSQHYDILPTATCNVLRIFISPL